MPDHQDTAQASDDRPMPGPGRSEDRPMPGPGRDGTDRDSESHGDASDAASESTPGGEQEEHEQEYVDREGLDFDPEDGLYTGTAVKGGTKIPGPHDQVDDVNPEDQDEEKVADE